jgi:hypothetical protein
MKQIQEFKMDSRPAYTNRCRGVPYEIWELTAYWYEFFWGQLFMKWMTKTKVFNAMSEPIIPKHLPTDKDTVLVHWQWVISKLVLVPVFAVQNVH